MSWRPILAGAVSSQSQTEGCSLRATMAAVNRASSRTLSGGHFVIMRIAFERDEGDLGHGRTDQVGRATAQRGVLSNVDGLMITDSFGTPTRETSSYLPPRPSQVKVTSLSGRARQARESPD